MRSPYRQHVVGQPAGSRSRRRTTAIGIALTLVTAVVTGLAPAAAAATELPLAQTKSIPVHPVPSNYRKPVAPPAWKAAGTTWPSGAAQVTLPTGAGAQAKTASPAAAARTGSLPVWLGPSATVHPKSATAGDLAAAPAVQVQIAPRSTATAVGVNGVVMSVHRTDANAAAAGVHLALGYSAFADAFGGDWTSRLHFVTLPACALTTPKLARCRTETPVSSATYAKSSTVTADLALPGAAGNKAAATTVLAATSSTGGGGGDYSATSLKPSGSWQAGGSSDAFTWSYPISVPPVPGGLQPNVSLDYDSQAVDGLTSSTNNQASWIGDGWDYSPGYIERSYTSCHQNPAGPTQTYDNCWSDSNTLTLSLGGQTSTLIRDDATGQYHPQADAHESVQYLTGAANNAYEGEHFVVTTTDGTKYYFGLNQLTGWQSGNATTNSVWTEPVFTPSPGQPCYNANTLDSFCLNMAYRWNLDYVVDTHSDTVAYFYNTESGNYARDNGTTANSSYIRGGYLAKVQYGQRDGAVYSSQPAAQVLFTSTGRCNQSSCDPATLNSATASNWPDVPYDLNCAANAACPITAPSFYSEYALQSIQTQALVGTTETNVDSWTLAHSFPDNGDGETPALWLNSISHSGQDTTAEPSSNPITLPNITFTGELLANRVNTTDGLPLIERQRIKTVTTETGETIDVSYSQPACGGSQPKPEQNTALCFPDYWVPPLQADPTEDWFNKYIVTEVTETDPTDASATDTIETHYTPVGSPAWHYNDNPTTPGSQRTWDQWRGYGGMIVTQGTAPDPITKTQYTYFRGMNGDTLPNGATRPATVTDSRGDAPVDDDDQYAGQPYETIVYNGSDVVTDTITDPFPFPATSTHALSGGLPAQHAYYSGTADTRVYTPLAIGGTRETKTSNTFDQYGRTTQVDDQGDLSTTADDLCTTTTYDDNPDPAVYIFDKPAEVSTVSVECGTTPSLPGNAVSDALTYYDNATDLHAPPTKGDTTTTQQATSYTGSTPNYTTMSSSTVDQYGRPLTATDARHDTTTTVYTPVTGAEPTSTKVTDPKGLATTTTEDSLRDLPLVTTDPANYVTTARYDALGRLTAVFKPGNPASSFPANVEYTYTVSDTGPSVVDTKTLDQDSGYRVSESLFDAMLRPVETQTQTPDNGRTITDTYYNSDGQVRQSDDVYFNASPISTSFVRAIDTDVPSSTGYLYDGANRKTTAISNASGVESWRTTYSYGGDSVTTVPPTGATATTTFSDARGHTTDLYQYHSGVPADPTDPAADYDHTRYTYFPSGKQASETNAAGETWSWTYDLLGHQTSSDDPDTGLTTTAYDGNGNVTSSTDARGKQISNVYDADDRKTASYDTTGGAAENSGDEVGSWTYDTVKKGYPTSSTSYSNGDTYTSSILSYSSYATPTTEEATLTGTDAGILPTGGYYTTYSYSAPTGDLATEGEPAIGGLPSESIVHGYDNFEEPTSLKSGSADYIYATGYDEFGKPLLYTLGGSGRVQVGLSYDQQTQDLTDIVTRTPANTTTTPDDKLHYNYGNATVSKGAGLITSITDTENAGATTDTQCFGYDYDTRLTQAWSATDNCAATPTPGNSGTVGGPSPYWQSWTYNTAGDRATETDHDTTGTTTTNYNYPSAAAGQPDTLTSTTATGPQATADTATYGYDADGNTTNITGGPTGNQTLTYDDRGSLATDVSSSGTSSYVYDADGNLLLRRDPGQTTLFLGDQQVVLNTATKATTATRYYDTGDTTIAVRSTGTNPVQYLVPDRQGTDQLAVNAATDVITRRHYLPFGAPRGTTPTNWPGDKGYVGGTVDTTTGLTNLGAREYNPANGRFLTPDPILETTDPTQLGGYDYAGNNPTTGSDPTGALSQLCSAGGACVSPPSATNPGPQQPSSGGGSHGGGGGSGGSHGGGNKSPTSHGSGSSWINTYLSTASPSMDDSLVPGQLEMAGLLTWALIPDELKQAIKEVLGTSPTASSKTQAAPPQTKTRTSGGMSLGLALANVGALGFTLLAGAGNVVPGLGEVGDAAAAEIDSSVIAADATALTADSATAAADDATADDSAANNNADSCTNSFAGSTTVLMADGTSKPIQQIAVGDEVANADPGAPVGQPDQHNIVTAVHITHTDHDYTDVTVSSATGPATITGTTHHLYWDTTTHRWTEAGNLQPGDQVQTSDGRTTTVTALTHHTSTMVTYNLTINHLHTYYVDAGHTPVLVHNCPISMDEAVARGADHVQGQGIMEISGSGGWQFRYTYTDENGTEIGKIARFDVNPKSGDVSRNGEHLNLETRIKTKMPNGRWDWVKVKTGPDADPHTPIDKSTIREGDYPK